MLTRPQTGPIAAFLLLLSGMVPACGPAFETLDATADGDDPSAGEGAEPWEPQETPTQEPDGDEQRFRAAGWPVEPRTGLSSTFGPRLKASEGYRYDFHRGIDIPAVLGTPVHAISPGVVRIAGEHDGYQDALVQVRHYRPGHAACRTHADGCYYSNYMHLSDWVVEEGDHVEAGDVIGYTGESESGFAHLHFEIRDGGLYQRHAVHPLLVLPYGDAGAPDLRIDGARVNRGELSVDVVVTMPATEADLRTIDVHVLDGAGHVVDEGSFDMIAWNRLWTPQSGNPNKYLDDPTFASLHIRPDRFNASSRDYGIHVDFQELVVPEDGWRTEVVATDVRGNRTVLIE